MNSAQRASLVPSQPRISFYASKVNFSHGLVMTSGVFGIHLLRDDQWDVIRALGLRSGRDVADKLADFEVRRGVTGCPMLVDCIASFECTVVNAMDAGGATFLLGDVVDTVEGEPGTVLTSERFRADAPADVREAYERGLAVAQSELEAISGVVVPTGWPGATGGV